MFKTITVEYIIICKGFCKQVICDQKCFDQGFDCIVLGRDQIKKT